MLIQFKTFKKLLQYYAHLIYVAAEQRLSSESEPVTEQRNACFFEVLKVHLQRHECRHCFQQIYLIKPFFKLMNCIQSSPQRRRVGMLRQVVQPPPLRRERAKTWTRPLPQPTMTCLNAKQFNHQDYPAFSIPRLSARLNCFTPSIVQ